MEIEKVKEQYTDEDMIYNAKKGNWETVWKILKDKPEYVNCIPEKSAWAALHQAVYLNNIEAVQTLVEEYGANVDINTKLKKEGVAEEGTSAIKLAKQSDDLDIYEYLLIQHILKQPPILNEDLLVRYHYNGEGTVKVTSEMLKNGLGINTQSGLYFRESEDIFKDKPDIQDMIQNAKFGNWEKVWEILKCKPYIVNCVPEKSSWSALHQAIYFNNIQAVKKLVEDFGADIVTYTRPNNDGDAEPGTSAKHLAKQRKNVDIFEYLIIQQLQQKEVGDKDLSQFAVHENGTVYPFEKYPLLQLTIASYKSLFSSSNQFFERNRRKHLSQVTFDIFQRFDEKWEEAAIKIRNTLYGIYFADLKDLSKPESKTKFFERIIRLYTEDSLYPFMHSALRRQHGKTYKPLARDLALAPFALTLSAILMYFEDLKPYSGITYRGVRENVDQYKVGKTIIFFSFISSSKQKKVAKKFAKQRGTLFIFNNGVSDKKWQPRSIENCSQYPQERECLYPLGAEFSVLCIDKTKREITLKLLNSKV